MADQKRRTPVPPRLDDEDDDDDLVGPRTGGTSASAARDDDDGPREKPRPRRAPRSAPARREPPRPRRAPARQVLDTGLLRTLVRDIPNFGKLLWGLATDARVSKLDKALVVAAVTYTLVPEDLIPDWIPGIGEIEDVFVIALALSRLLTNAGEEVLLDHWDGDDETLETLLDALAATTDMLPSPIRGLIAGRG